MKQKLVVIGNGMAGIHTIENLLEKAPDDYRITVFGSEPYGHYNRILLTPLLHGEKTRDEIMIHDRNWYRRHDVTLQAGPGKTVIAVDRQRRRVMAQDGAWADYDRLIIATGARPARPDAPGLEADGVVYFRDLADVEKMIEQARKARRAVVLGGGLLGLEAACGLQRRGLEVIVIHKAGHLLNRQLDAEAGRMLKSELERRGVNFRLGVSLARVHTRHGRVAAAELSDGSFLPCDLLIPAIGIQPNINLARSIGLNCARGVLVDDTLTTSDASIHAVGECVQHRGQLFGLVAPIYRQAEVLARRLAGDRRAFFQSVGSATRLKVAGIDLFSAGDIEGGNDSALVFCDPELAVYKKLVLAGDTIKGVLLYGDTEGGAWYLDCLQNQREIKTCRETLLFGPPSLAA